MTRSKKTLFLLLSAIILAGIHSQALAWQYPWNWVPHWDWSSTNVDAPNFFNTLSFPHNFEWGIGDSAFQTEGVATSNGPIENNWTQQVGAEKIGTACDRWQRWQEDIDHVVQSGFTTYRMSVEWAKIEPGRGQFDHDAIEHYRQMCQYARSKGLKVMVVLFHHTWPTWFYGATNHERRNSSKEGLAKHPAWADATDSQPLIGFEDERGSAEFVTYAHTVITALKDYVDVWVPFNEPDGYAMQGYYRGQYPPMKKDLQLTGRVIAHMLKAHVTIAELVHATTSAQVSITKVVQHIDPYRWYHPLELSVTTIFDYLFNTAFINFFKTGVFSWYVPGLVNVSYTNAAAPDSIDFFGINYYSHSSVKINLLPKPGADTSAAQPGEQRADNGRVIYAEGLYRAIERCAAIGKPMIITENGVADAHDAFRELYIRRHLYALKTAIDDGYDVRGYHYWSLMDNFEWTHGYTQKFGLYAVNFNNPEKTRTLRPTAQAFVAFVQQQKECPATDA